ncbi:MAG: DMT family transporter [Steroidobacteraceae bacterium]|jgi:drug/metabolite transporter (DMT)-like permease
MQRHRRGFLLVSASAIAWSTAGLFTRIIHLDAWSMLAWRGLFGAAGLAAVLAGGRGAAWRDLMRLGRWGWVFVLQSAAGMIFFITALRTTTVAHVAVIYATVPFFAAGLGWLVLREKPTGRAVAASLVALAGVALMVGIGREGGILGDVLALGMTLTMAVAMVVARHFRDMPFLPAACLASLISGVLSWPFGQPRAVTGQDLLLLAMFGLVTFAVGLPLFTLGARLLPAIETALIGSLEAPLAPLWVWLLFNETPAAATIGGGLMVVAAVILYLAAPQTLRGAAPAQK